jgi:phage tail tape-measure protein
MNSSTTQQASVKPVDPDLAEQAVSGHGVPSQDPTPAAQVALEPGEAERESQSAMMGGGVIAGSAAGAAVGAAVGGPVGVLVGGTIGAVAGALGGGAAGKLVGGADTVPADEADIPNDDHAGSSPPRSAIDTAGKST